MPPSGIGRSPQYLKDDIGNAPQDSLGGGSNIGGISSNTNTNVDMTPLFKPSEVSAGDHLGAQEQPDVFKHPPFASPHSSFNPPSSALNQDHSAGKSHFDAGTPSSTTDKGMHKPADVATQGTNAERMF